MRDEVSNRHEFRGGPFRAVPGRVALAAVAVGMLAVAACSDDDPVQPAEDIDVTVTGAVTAQHDDSGIEGAEVEAYDPRSTTPVAEATSDSDGSYELSFLVSGEDPPDNIRLEADAEGYEDAQLITDFSESISADVTMQPVELEASVSGTAVEQLSGDPASGADVAAYHSDDNTLLAEATSDDAGAYELSFEIVAPDAPEYVRVEAEGAEYAQEREVAFDEAMTLDLALGPFAGGTGSGDDPYLLATAEHLQAIEKDLAGHYRLEGDIDANATSDWNDGDGFEPIGGWDPEDDEHEPFEGHLDGAGHAIDGLTIDRPLEEIVGIFAYVADATIEDVALTHVDVFASAGVGALASVAANSEIVGVSAQGIVAGLEGQVGGLFFGVLGGEIRETSVEVEVVANGPWAGGLAAAAQDGAEIHESTASGLVLGEGEAVGGMVGALSEAEIHGSTATGHVENTSDDPDTGGLVGDGNDVLIAHSSASGDVETEGSNAGGLVGGLCCDARVEASEASGDVQGDSRLGGLVGNVNFGAEVEGSRATGRVEGESHLGGLAGRSRGDIQTSYATGEVTGDGHRHGGLLGDMRDNASVSESFATGEVTSESSYAGGLVGDGDDGEIGPTYWDVETTGYTSGNGGLTDDGDAEGLTTDEMTGDDAEDNLDALDFDEDWATVADDYPRLWWEDG